jgi:hypothetical protein
MENLVTSTSNMAAVARYAKAGRTLNNTGKALVGVGLVAATGLALLVAGFARSGGSASRMAKLAFGGATIMTTGAVTLGAASLIASEACKKKGSSDLAKMVQKQIKENKRV